MPCISFLTRRSKTLMPPSACSWLWESLPRRARELDAIVTTTGSTRLRIAEKPAANLSSRRSSMRRWTMTGAALALILAVGSGGYAQTPGTSTEKMDKDKGMVKKDDSKMMNKMDHDKMMPKKDDVKMMNKKGDVKMMNKKDDSKMK